MSGSENSLILLVEDDEAFANEFATLLRSFGYKVDIILALDELEHRVRSRSYDLVVLDQFVRGQDALAHLAALRLIHPNGLVILTNNADEIDRVVGLELGADDFIHKLQKPREILARLRAVLRRSASGERLPPVRHEERATEPPARPSLAVDAAGWRIDPLRREVLTPEGVQLRLTAAEFDVVQYMARRRGTIVDRDDLYTEVMGRPKTGPADRTADNLISRLRRAFSMHVGGLEVFRPIRGRGYIYIGPELTSLSGGQSSSAAR